MAPKTQEFIEVLEKHRGEKHLVVLHDYPDPDAISSAFAHRLISAEYDIDVDITYTGKISHSQNVALVKLLGIDLIPYNGNLDLTKYQGAVFLDNQGTTVNGLVKSLEMAGVPVLIMVDHHEPGRDYPRIQRYPKDRIDRHDLHPLHRTRAAAVQKSRKEHVAVATALTARYHDRYGWFYPRRGGGLPCCGLT